MLRRVHSCIRVAKDSRELVPFIMSKEVEKQKRKNVKKAGIK
jgi:hypothetical protein